ncbi:glycosyltransferase family 4 protein [Pedobacter alpinus]|uniref:Glycosyltransferase family 4 protein n=1 Tax=Pedobacter alpinus TaxID=1590643 RepID=A0ABW5TSG0_9SPHI
MGTKRILVYTENYLPSIGGLENNTLLLCESLVLLGHHLTLLTPQKNALNHAKFNVLESKSLYLFYNQVKNHDLVMINGGVSFKIIIPSIFALKPFMIIYQMATLFKDIRNNSLKTKVLNKLRWVLAKLAKANIGVSQYSFLELKKAFGRHNSKLLINPADPTFSNQDDDHYDDILPKTPFQCLFAGRLIEGKGVSLIVDAVKEINKYKEVIHLHFVGDGPERGFLQHQNTKHFIYYHEPVSKEQLKEWLKKVHLTVIPSTSHIEGSPLIMAESLMMGVPVLVSSQPAMVASVQKSNLIFESGDLNDLIKKLNFLVDAASYSNIKKYCKLISVDYSYTNYIKNLKAIINV